MARTRRSAVEVRRSLVGDQIAPALKGPVRAWLHQLDLAVEHDAAAADAVLVPERLDAEDALAAEYLAPDHPEQRAAIQQLIHALRDHAGAVEALPRLAGFLFLGQLLLDPVLEVLNGIAADAQLDEMQGHGAASSMMWSRGRKFRPHFSTSQLDVEIERGSRCCLASLDRQDPRTFRNLRADLGGNFDDRPVERREQRMLHLHGLDHRDALALADARALLDQDRQHLAVHRGGDCPIAIEVVDIDGVIALERNMALRALPDRNDAPHDRQNAQAACRRNT